MTNDNHSKYHPTDAFGGNAGPYEMEHLDYLVSQITNEELKRLVNQPGIFFPSRNVPQEEYENVVDEASREDFYREYHRILEERKEKKKNK